jgi:hypothetical protein
MTGQQSSWWSRVSGGGKVGFDKAWTLVDKLGAPVNKLSNKLGSEAFWPTSLDKESDKAARILRSFCSMSTLLSPITRSIPLFPPLLPLIACHSTHLTHPLTSLSRGWLLPRRSNECNHRRPYGKAKGPQTHSTRSASIHLSSPPQMSLITQHRSSKTQKVSPFSQQCALVSGSRVPVVPVSW